MRIKNLLFGSSTGKATGFGTQIEKYFSRKNVIGYIFKIIIAKLARNKSIQQLDIKKTDAGMKFTNKLKEKGRPFVIQTLAL